MTTARTAESADVLTPEIRMAMEHGPARYGAGARIKLERSRTELNVVGPHFSEELLLDVALTVERERPWPLTVHDPRAAAATASPGSRGRSSHVGAGE